MDDRLEIPNNLIYFHCVTIKSCAEKFEFDKII